MAAAAGGDLVDQPSEGEVALFQKLGTQFQIVSVVASMVAVGRREERLVVTPFALTLMPAQKRGVIDVVSIDKVAKVDISRIAREAEAFYTGFDPFSGEWDLYGLQTPELVAGPGFLDEIGLVVDAFYLATSFDPDDVLAPDIGLPAGKNWERYARHRRELLFKPFQRVEARRVWGVESPIELFLVQELARRGVHPQLQMLITDDGRTFPSLYHLWGDIDFRYGGGLVTEADLFFPEQRVAVFCDGGRFHRGKKRKKDLAINAKLQDLGITPLRIKGRIIVQDLGSAADLVMQSLGRDVG
jgi:hypothetical protein